MSPDAARVADALRDRFGLALALPWVADCLAHLADANGGADAVGGWPLQRLVEAVFSFFLNADLNAVGRGHLPPNVQVGPGRGGGEGANSPCLTCEFVIVSY
jgi:hypothetical protein